MNEEPAIGMRRIAGAVKNVRFGRRQLAQFIANEERWVSKDTCTRTTAMLHDRLAKHYGIDANERARLAALLEEGEA
jgi:hypothetical protein